MVKKFPAKTNNPEFKELVDKFLPNLSPDDIFKLGSFGGTYWRPIVSQVTGKIHKNRHLKFKRLGWFRGLSNDKLTKPFDEYDVNINKYKVKCGSTLEDWESKNWITKHDPYGWVEWYCNFYLGRRNIEEDTRQIQRWLNFCGPNGRFKRSLINKVKAADSKAGNPLGTSYNDPSISPVIRQSLQHWGYKLTRKDVTN